MSRVIVTGGCGFIGTKLVLKLVHEGHSVVVIDKDSPDLEIVDVHYIKRELGCDMPLPEFHGVDIVYHLAAEARVQKTYDDPVLALDNNTKATLEVLQAARTYNVKRVVYASTSSVYKNYDESLALKEGNNIDPCNPYGISKLHGEQWCMYYGQNTSIDTVCLRFFNVYGESQKLDGPYTQVTRVFLDQIERGVPLTINGNGNQTRDFTYIDDIVNGIILSGENTKREFKGKAINLGTGNSHSIFNIAKHFAKSFVFNPPKPGENLHDKADISRASHLLSWKPTMNVIEWMEGQL
ncbi:NAD-dependent epimerase/dehydratase family protein [bacterium]|nr:NAD-dependent epimerase/dehydratase family protein [bacterium]